MPTADELLSSRDVLDLARVLAEQSPRGTRWPALRASADTLAALTLSQRARAVAVAILADCPDYVELAQATRAGLTSPALTGWMVWPLTEAVATAAVHSGDARCFDDGLALLAALTPRLTSEFALRIFLDADLDRTLAVVRTWTDHDDDTVRRLASEGTRPKLPWARQVKGLITDPTLTRPILDALHLDESPFVRRSVANHLNDVSRLNPSAAVSTAESWAKQPGPHTASTIRHAMRSLIKAGDARALALLGFTATLADLHVSGPAVDRHSISLGEAITFTADVTNTSGRTATLVIDYVVHHRKANGATTPKVFKLATRRIESGATITLTRRHAFTMITTRRYYTGTHGLELQINGQPTGYAEFHLAVPPE